MNPVNVFLGLIVLSVALLFLMKSPESRFLFRRVLQSTWPVTEGRIARAAVDSNVVADDTEWDSVLQVSYMVNGEPMFGYFAFRLPGVSYVEAQKLQTSWEGAKVMVHYDPRNPETFVLDRNSTGGNYVIYFPQLGGASIAGSPDPLHLPKNVSNEGS